MAAAALTAFVIGGHGTAPASPEAHPSDKTTTLTETHGVRLVSYTGTQPTGYTLDKVPVGWVIDHDDLSLLTIAPAGATPDREPPGTVSLEGKISITTQTTGVPHGVPLDDIRVGGHSAVIAHMLGSGDTRTLFVEQASGTYPEIQVWTGLSWDDEEIAAFASSVHINPGAKTVVG